MPFCAYKFCVQPYSSNCGNALPGRLADLHNVLCAYSDIILLYFQRGLQPYFKLAYGIFQRYNAFIQRAFDGLDVFNADYLSRNFACGP